MVYFAYGALGLIAVAESFWVKKALTLSPAQLAELAVWTTLPWTVKMVFGELVDSVPILGSQRRAYVFIGAAFIAAGCCCSPARRAAGSPSLAPRTSIASAPSRPCSAS